MKRTQAIKNVLCFFILLTMSVSRGQISPSDDRIVLYKLNANGMHGIQGKYVLCANYDLPEKGKVSLVVIGDTFSVEMRGPMCKVTMTNTDVLQTRYDLSRSNQLVQTKMWTDGYTLTFPGHTLVIFDNSMVELSKFKIGSADEAGAKVYEGEDALRELKKMGQEPPEDMDMDKAVSNQKKVN